MGFILVSMYMKFDRVSDMVVSSAPVIEAHTEQIKEAKTDIKSIQIEMRNIVAVQDRFKDLYKYLEPQRH